MLNFGGLMETRRRALQYLMPPRREPLSDWAESNIELVNGARLGPLHLWPFQREIADAIGDPALERVTIVKPARVGYTTLLASAVGSYVVNDPAAILCLLPTEDDARRFCVDEVEPIFEASAALAGSLTSGPDETNRNTLYHRRFPGGSLKFVAAKAPRNLRAHTVRILFMDEVDAMEVGKEGDPILLAEKRTTTFPDRKIVLGSTPVDEETSAVLKAYSNSDQRIYEVRCPCCETYTAIEWKHIVWEEGRPETAAFKCPHCEKLISERHKSAMVRDGRWRATRPEVKGHAGFRFNALVSPAPNAGWGQLATEFVQAKGDPARLKPFVNTILAQGWKGEGDAIEAVDLESSVERIGLNERLTADRFGIPAGTRLAIPEEVLCITVGVDVADDRLELTYVGWDEFDYPFVLAHDVVWGQHTDDFTWRELEERLSTKWDHPLGGRIGIEAALIDSGDGQHKPYVYRFAFPRMRRRIFASKGLPGFKKPKAEFSKSKIEGGGRLVIVGVDTIKGEVFRRLAAKTSVFRFSASLTSDWFDQLTSERFVVKYRSGRPEPRFERILGRKAEALDCVVYATAARHLVRLNVEQRRADLSRSDEQLAILAKPKPTRAPSSGWIDRGGDSGGWFDR